MPNPAPTRYAVRQLVWVQEDDADVNFLKLLPGKTDPVETFATRDAADAAAATWEAEERARVNPFTHGGPGLFYQSSLDAPRFHDWLLDAGIDPPRPRKKGGEPDYAAWWKRAAPTLTPAQRAAVWQALDKVRFFEVVEENPGQKAYVVVEVTWTWNDQPWYDADPEGGQPQKAFRDRTRAEAYCDELNRRKRADGGLGYDSYNYEGRVGHTGAGETVYPIDEAAFYEVIEIEVEG